MYGIRNVMPTITIRLAAVTIRATNSALPGEGANSSLIHSRNQTSGRPDNGKDCAIAAISTPAYHDDCGFTDSEQIGTRILDTYPDRVARRQMYPVQCSLHIRK